MNEIDLIPVEYRARREQLAMLKKYVLGFVAINILVLGAGIALGSSAQQAQARVLQLKSENAISQQQQDQLQQLKIQRAEYERRWSLLRGLRAGAAVDDIFSLVDKSLVPGELWFLDWSFRRAGVVVDGQQRGIETGYFIIVAEEGGAIADMDLEVETHMTIRGQAKDHQALSKFVRALFEQPDIKDVNVQKTAQTGYANGRVVEFDLTVVLNSTFRDT